MAGQWTFPDGVCEQHNIPNKSMRYWPKDIARADRKEQGPAFIPVSVSGLPESRGTTATAPADEPVTLYPARWYPTVLPGSATD